MIGAPIECTAIGACSAGYKENITNELTRSSGLGFQFSSVVSMGRAMEAQSA
jgi:hypothetical protein